MPQDHNSYPIMQGQQCASWVLVGLVVAINTATVDLLGTRRLKPIRKVFVEVFWVQDLFNAVLNVRKASHI